MKTGKIILISIFVVAVSIGLNACNTIDGAGKDIEHAGEAVQDSSN